jgi:hypothetical protein
MPGIETCLKAHTRFQAGWYRYNARIVSSLVGLLQIVSYMLHPYDSSLKKI